MTRALLLSFVAALAALPAAPNLPTPPNVDGYWGVALGLHPVEAARRDFAFPPDVVEVAETGATHVLLPITALLDAIDGHVIDDDPETVDDEQLRAVFTKLRRVGLVPVVMPFLRLRDPEPTEWRGNLRPTDPEAFWASYEAFVLRYARLAEEADAPLFAIGSELSSMSGPETSPRWSRLAGRVRQVYGGRLAYVSNHDALDQSGPYEHVDVVGVSAYFRLTDSADASELELRAAWSSIGERLERLAAEANRPLVLFEIGYPSLDGGAIRPWKYTIGTPVDLEEQRRAYAAACAELVDAPWLEGAFFWTWFGPGGPYDRYYTPRAKPAEKELRRFLWARTTKPQRDALGNALAMSATTAP